MLKATKIFFQAVAAFFGYKIQIASNEEIKTPEAREDWEEVLVKEKEAEVNKDAARDRVKEIKSLTHADKLAWVRKERNRARALKMKYSKYKRLKKQGKLPKLDISSDDTK